MNRRKLVALVSFAACAGLLMAGCGTTGSTAPATSGAALAGNWLLAGSLPNAVDATQPGGIALSLDVSGTTITGSSSYATGCTSLGAPTSLSGNTIALTGTIAANGTFSLGQISGTAGGVVISGTAPAQGASSWSGTYSIAYPSGYCATSTAITGPFTATPFSLVSGTYAGTGSSAPQRGGTSFPVTMSLALKQGGTLYVATPVTSNLALSGTVAIQGISCFSHGTTLTTAGHGWSQMDGNTTAVGFTMDDGSVVGFDTYVTNSASSNLMLNAFQVTGGNCAGGYVFATPLTLH